MADGDTRERGSGRPDGGAYRLADGTIAPSITTVIKRFGESAGLIRWAWKQGRNGVSLDDARNRAADIGSTIHGMVEAEVHGESVDNALLDATPHTRHGPDEEFVTKCRRGFDAYRRWRDGWGFEIFATEVPLVSEAMRVGGTGDGWGRNRRGELGYAEWKSGGLYDEHKVQCAANGLLWHECRGELPSEYHLLRFNKDSGAFEHRFYADLTPGARAFRLMRELYDVMYEVKKL